MKILNLSIIALLSVTVFAGCGKEEVTPEEPTPTAPVDNVAPVLTLLGQSKDTCFLQSIYTDAGATALDNVDGNITGSIVVTGSVSTAAVGTYTIAYNVKDVAGNNAIALTRTVVVLNSAYKLAGNYNVACSFTAEIPGNTPTITTVNYPATFTVSNTSNNSVGISLLKTGPEGISPIFTKTGTTFDVYFSSQNYPRAEGSGTINTQFNTVTIDTKVYDNMYPSRDYLSRNVYTKIP